MDDVIESGLCQCGCGEKSGVYAWSDAQRGWVKGKPKRFAVGHNGVKPKPAVKTIYRRLTFGDRSLAVHRYRAECALGRPLPKSTRVHHADGTTRDDAPLVICESDAYHKLLHVRMNVLRAGGNPNSDKICQDCRRVVRKVDFYPSVHRFDGLHTICKPCSSIRSSKYQRRRKLAEGATMATSR